MHRSNDNDVHKSKSFVELDDRKKSVPNNKLTKPNDKPIKS